ncbi:MAG: hypothetical protein RCO49_04030 [Rickettsia endosymbiont of Argas persicus]
MYKRLSSLASGNSSRKEKILEDPSKKTIINEIPAVQAQIVSAIKNQEPIENIKNLLKPYLPKDTLVILAAKNIIHTNRPITEVKTILKLSVSPNNLVIESVIKYAEERKRNNEDIEELKSYKSELKHYLLKNAAQDGDIEKLEQLLNSKEEIDINSDGTVKLSKLVSKSTMFLYFRQQEVFE